MACNGFFMAVVANYDSYRGCIFPFSFVMSRIVRFLLIAAAVVAALVLAAVIALFTLINEKSVESTLSRLARSAFNADVTLSQHVTISRFPALVVEIPQVSFKDRETKEEKARLDAARVQVALWSLPLGAVNIVKADVAGLATSLQLSAPTTDALVAAFSSALTFPDNVRVKNVTFTNADLDVTAGEGAARRHWKFTGVNLKLDGLSPEMTTGFDITGAFSGDVEKAAAAAPAEVVPPDPAPTETPAPAESTEPSAPQTAEEPAGAPVSEPPAEAPTTAPAPADAPKAAAPEVSLLNYFVPAAHAAEVVPALPAPTPGDAPTLAETITAFTQGASGSFSATGTIAVSASDKTVSFEKLKFSADVTKADRHFSVVTGAELLSVAPHAITGTNVNASVSEPEAASGDVHLGAVDFRLVGNRLQSPEMRLAYSETEASGKVTSYEASASVDSDLMARRTHLENLTTRVTVTGDASLPQDFTAQASGFMNLDFAADKAQVGLSGTFAGAPFSFNGTIADLKAPKAAGELMISAVDFQSIPRFKTLGWMKAADFAGELRIGQVKSGAFTASQVHSRMTVKDGAVTLKNVIVTLADGRLLGEASMTNDASWRVDGRLDGVNLERLFTSFSGTPVLSGIASGAFTATGLGLDPAAVQAQGSVRLLRGAYKGINARAVRDFIAGRGKAETITQAGAWTEIDEASGDLALVDTTLTVKNFVSRSVFQRTNADFTAALTTGDITGQAATTFAPAGGIPAVRVTAAIAGKTAAPVWTFDFEDARKNLLRAQGRPLVKEKKEERHGNLWQSVKDFFRF